MKKVGYAAFAGALLATLPAWATPITANLSTPTDLGFFAAGSYTITATGVVDLVGIPGSGFDINPDGTPTSTVTMPNYSYFNPNGSFTADGNFGAGGATVKIGALMGAFTAGGPFFQIGYTDNLTLLAGSEIFAQLNDTFYPNNGGAFNVSVSRASAAAEPFTLSLFGGALAGGAAAIRRFRTKKKI